MIKKSVAFLIINIILFIFFMDVGKSNYKNIFFDYSVTLIEGEKIKLSKYSEKVILLVNTASHCGFTKQYADLEKLWLKYKDKKLVILAIPSNSFNQEKDNNKEVKDFCETNFNITFPMTVISKVKGKEAHEIYKWAKKNFGNSAIPKWNFHKILIGKNGKIVDTFASFTNPLSKRITNSIEKLLN